MSFKRDGDDFSALNYQRKSRVTELLQEDITDQEVSKLRNGKFVCKLCFHKPIFDTLSIFYVHKQGKKHLASQEYHALQKQEVDDLIEKRMHEKTVNIEQSQVQQQIKVKVQHKARPSPYHRRKVMDLHYQPSSETSTAFAHSLSGNKTAGTEVERYSGKNVKHLAKDCVTESLSNNHVKMSLTDKEKCDVKWKNRKDNLKTYVKLTAFKSRDDFNNSCDDNEEIVSSANVNKFINNSDTENTKNYYLARKKQKSDYEKDIQATLIGKVHKETDATSTCRLGQSWEMFKSGAIHKTSTPLFTQECVKKKTNSARSYKDVDRSKTADAEKMLQAFGSGWKKDWTGQWVKDDTVEFDSDEEPPNF
ncbi:sodium channel modifier 1-like [Dreissena polymorpha]|uniref:Sodium channel modifier 1 n=1 Tax=Dreissena polymorpha TaxID=45954 RepID=A0A9D4S576_DREPO|nr:sodium channel modifier 1-like [Dreissena polymorpha]KAH3891030.1 hypothetical protein DPMN_015121 [Dreissena polymorpha]